MQGNPKVKTTTLWNDLLNLAFVTVTRFGDDSINELDR